MSPVAISRNRLAGVLIDQLIHACRRFANDGLTPFLGRWDAYDRLHGQTICLRRGSESLTGIYRGIAPSGAMLLQQSSGTSEHHAGEVSLVRAGDA